MRLRQICFVAHDLEKTLNQFCDLLKAEVCFKDPGVGHFGLANGLIEIGGNFLEVVSPIEENTTAGRYLDRMKGDSGYMLIFQCENAQTFREKAEELNIDCIPYNLTFIYKHLENNIFSKKDITENKDKMKILYEVANNMIKENNIEKIEDIKFYMTEEAEKSIENVFSRESNKATKRKKRKPA